jgi:glutamate carboxypeptidase
MAIPEPAEQLRYFRRRQSRMVDSIRQLVEIESPTDIKAAVDRLGAVLGSRFGELGGNVRMHPAEKFGNHLEVSFPVGNRNDPPVLLLGHMDTVHRIGTIAKMPTRISQGRLHGPGVLDMKAGIALALEALDAMMRWQRGKLSRPVTVLMVSDEEVGSQSSRAITERLALEASAVLVLEPAAGLNGAVKTARKGVGEYTIRVSGKAAHSGLDFGNGHSAILELAQQVLELARMVDLKRGVTVNVGKISGGTRVNVVPAEASASFDVRVATQEDAHALHKRLVSLKPSNGHCQVTVSGAMNRPPMERGPGTASLFNKASALAAAIGWQLEEAAVGGGSDGNFTAALGAPTLDGLGAVGEGAHAEHESIVISELPRRAALLAGLIASL